MKYLLDSNIFIQAYNQYYAKEIVPSFWRWLEKDEEIYTIKQVKEEIKKGRNGLYDLIKNIQEVQIEEVQKVADNIREVEQYITKTYPDKSENKKFSDAADFQLIVAALNNQNITIVTHEVLIEYSLPKYRPPVPTDRPKVIKIPNVCKDYSIKCINTFELLKIKKVSLCNY